MIELFCGAFGWSHGWLEMGGQAVGFDLEHHPWHGPVPVGAELVLQDVRTLHGSQFREADLILASPPCQFFSYTAMPFSRAKKLAAEVRSNPALLAQKLELFRACFRIQREACEAAGRFIPMVVENVVGAQVWVGQAKAHFGSFYLYGDVPALIPRPRKRAQKFNSHDESGSKTPGGSWFRERNGEPQAGIRHEERGSKNTGGSWFNVAHNTTSGLGQNARDQAVKIGGDWYSDPKSHCRKHSSRSNARKAASAQIAIIPPTLSRWIAQCYWPEWAVRGEAVGA